MWQPKSKIISTRRRPHFTGKQNKVVRENTYLREPQPQLPPRPTSKLSWLIFLLPFILVGGFYFFSGLLISGIDIPPTKNIDRAEIVAMFEEQKKEPVALFFNQSNLFLFNAREFEDKLNDKYQFNSLAIKKNFRNLSLLLILDEKDINLVWQEEGKYYFINYAGDIILSKPTSSTSSLGDLLSLLNTDKPKKKDRKIIIDEKYLRFASALNEAIKNKTKGLTGRRLAIGSEYDTVKVLVYNGPIIYFNTDGNIDEQVGKLEALRRAELSDGQIFNSQRYIDLRYGKSIFYQ